MAANGVKRAQATSDGESRLQASLEEKARDLEARLLAPLGAPTAEQTSDYKAQWGDLVLCNEEDRTITLPSALRSRVGQFIVAKNLHASDAMAIQPAGSDTIDGSSDTVTVPSLGVYGYLCVAEGEWIELWRPHEQASAPNVPKVEVWAEHFLSALSGDWTQIASLGTITVAGGVLTLYVSSAVYQAYWNESVKTYTGIRIDLDKTGTLDDCLIMIEASVSVQDTSAWAGRGVVLWEDNQNIYGCEVCSVGSSSTYFTRVFKATDNAFTWDTTFTTSPSANTILRIYWNKHPTDSFIACNGDVLAAGQVRCYRSTDGGSSYLAIAAAETLAIVPTAITLYVQNTQPYFPLDADTNYILVARTTNPAGF